MSRLWHPNKPRSFPTPGVRLLVKLRDGSITEAIRPNYVASYNDDPDFRDLNNNPIKGVIEWSIK